eukprot:TRINITY_DN535_c3_g1_i2.p1 TRINITY_DN535_c3_g1~~TRINITY_DN535_c3_g1_i2.p1  ORF type:complete len:496 (+),score=77.30 TRINITY_DN535_c3_g1_i2:84-1571(+)
MEPNFVSYSDEEVSETAELFARTEDGVEANEGKEGDTCDADGGKSAPIQSVAERSAINNLYFAHFLQTFADRMWQFAIPYLFFKLWGNNMLPQSFFCLCIYSTCFFGMFGMGVWMDTTPRLKLLNITIGVGCLSILASVFFFWMLLETGGHNDKGNDKEDLQLTLPLAISFAGLLITAIVAELMARTGTMAVERDWVVVIADGNKDYQTQLNGWMRRIDLCCKLGGPLFFVLIEYIVEKIYSGDGNNHDQFKIASASVAIYNLIGWPLQLNAIRKVYNAFPALSNKVMKTEAEMLLEKGRTAPHQILYDGASAYWHHPIRNASIAYCQLWMTVLDNGTLMTAYLLWTDVHILANVGSRGIGAMFGILGTFIFPHLRKRLNSGERAGLYSLFAFLAFIITVVIFFLLPFSASTKSYVMIVMVVMSRTPLWSFDLSIQQILQERIAEDQRGVINGVHGALCQLELVCVYFSFFLPFFLLFYFKTNNKIKLINRCLCT